MKDSEVSALVLPPDYGEWLVSLKQRIRGARQRAVIDDGSHHLAAPIDRLKF
jgi:hypothetical protein